MILLGSGYSIKAGQFLGIYAGERSMLTQLYVQHAAVGLGTAAGQHCS